MVDPVEMMSYGGRVDMKVGDTWKPMRGFMLCGPWHPPREIAPCRVVSEDGASYVDTVITRELWENMHKRWRLQSSPLMAGFNSRLGRCDP